MSAVLAKHDNRTPRSRAEGFVHFVAREGQFALRVIIMALIALTALTMATIFYLVFIPLILLVAAYALLAACNRVESMTRRGDEAESAEASLERMIEPSENNPDDPAWKQPIVPVRVLRHELKLGVEIMFGIGVAATVMAVILLPAEALLVGAVVVFCYMMLVLAPVWLGWLTEDFEHEYEDDAATTRANAHANAGPTDTGRP